MEMGIESYQRTFGIVARMCHADGKLAPSWKETNLMNIFDVVLLGRGLDKR